MNKSLLAIIPAALALCGCVSVPNVDANKEAVNQTKRITLLAIPEPANIQLMNLGGAAGAFGAIGGLVQGVSNADHTKAFVASLADHKISFNTPLIDALEGTLRRDGFEVSVDKTQRPKRAADGKGDDYSDIRVDSDAILIVWFNVVGYMSPPSSMHYEPWVIIKARLIDAKTKQDIYFKTFCLGYQTKVENAVFIPADPKYRYRSYDDLMENFSHAVDGILSCELLAARQVGDDLKAK
jgi:hypothetical protein